MNFGVKCNKCLVCSLVVCVLLTIYSGDGLLVLRLASRKVQVLSGTVTDIFDPIGRVKASTKRINWRFSSVQFSSFRSLCTRLQG